MIRLAACLLLVVTAGSALPAEEEAYVASLYAKVRSATSFPNQTVATVERGTALTVLAEDGHWSRVRLADGRTGYVSSRHLSEDEPGTEGTFATIGRMSRSEGESVAGTAGGRGVGPVATEYAQGKNASAALADVEWLEERPYIPDAIEAFMQEGGIGDYRN